MSKSMNIAPFATALAAMLALGLPSIGNAAEKSTVKPGNSEPAVQSNKVQPGRSPTADARQMGIMVRSQAAMMPASQQMKAPRSLGIDPTRRIAFQDARQPMIEVLPSRALSSGGFVAGTTLLMVIYPPQAMTAAQVAAANPSRSIAVLPSQAMKAGGFDAMDASRSVVVAQMQRKPGLAGEARSTPVAMMAMFPSKNPGRTMSPVRISPEKAAQMQRAARSPVAKWQVKHRLQQ